MTINKSVSVACGIYDTAYQLQTHRNGTITVKAPYIKWRNNNGVLAFTKYKIDDREVINAVLTFFKSDRLELQANTKSGILTLDDVLDGHLHPGVRVIAA